MGLDNKQNVNFPFFIKMLISAAAIPPWAFLVFFELIHNRYSKVIH